MGLGRWRRVAQIGLILGMFALLTAGLDALIGGPSTPVAAAQEGREDIDGENLFDRDCASCHGSQGQGTAFAPALDGFGTAGIDFVLRTGRMPPTFDLAELADGGAPDDALVPSEPAYEPAEIAAIVEHTASFVDGPEVPEVPTVSTDQRSAELYQKNCAACHKWSGVGGALTGGGTAPDLRDSSAVEVVEAMRYGPGTMPVFSEAVLDEGEAAAIAGYVDTLENAPSPGGHPLAFIGPVPEGLVAWAVGIVALLLLVRWIGRRA